jgi:hypothetical protein
MQNVAHKTNLNDNNSRLLGNGEPVFPGVYWRLADLSAGETWNLIDANLLDTGLIVDHDGDFEYRHPLTIQGRETVMDRFTSGSVRQNKVGKGRYDLLPLEGMRALAMHYERGAAAHGDRNWELGQPLSVFKNSLTRHACQVGYAFDEDHAAAVAWNAFGYITTMERIRAGLLPIELDDLGVCDKEVVR